jgi:YidC/Oxa1 family membrane protein insertase
MNPWTVFIELLAGCLVVLSQLLGGNLGWAIFTVSLLARVAILPLSARLNERARRQRQAMQAIEPKINRLKRRYKADPNRLAQETLKLYRQNGIKPVDLGGLAGAFLQLPIFMALYSAIRKVMDQGGRFIWMGDIGQPDSLLALLVGGLTFISASLNPDLPQKTRYLSTLLPAILMVIFYWKFAAGLGLYGLASQVVSVVQMSIVRWRRE